MNLRKLFVLNALVFGFLGLSMALALIFFTDHLRTSANGIEVAIRSVHAAEKLQIALLSYDREIARPEPALNELRSTISNSLKDVEAFIDTEEERSLVADTANDIETYFSSPRGLRKQRLSRANSSLDHLVTLNIAQSEQLQAQMYKSQTLSDSLGLACIAFLIFGGAAIAILQRVNISRPLLRLHETLRQFSFAPFSAVKNQLEGVIEIQDISKVVNQMSQALIRQRESQFRLLAAIAHDLRNPLNGIKMSVDLLNEEDKAEDRAEVLQIVRRQAEHLDRLVGDLLDTTRIEAGDILLKPQRLDLRDPVREAAQLFKNTSQAHELKVIVPETPVLCDCDPSRISQVLNNLLSNAIKYSPEGGIVEVQIKAGPLDAPSLALIEVADEGIGISASEVSTVFEPFHRSAVTRDTFPGVGLGLSAARKIIEAHHGKIVIDTGRPRGTCFKVYLPLLK